MRYWVFDLLFLLYPLSLDIWERAHQQHGSGFRIGRIMIDQIIGAMLDHDLIKGTL